MNVLLGKNASGKTTLLDLVAAITSDDLGPLAREAEGFSFEYDLTSGSDELAVHVQRNPRAAVERAGLIAPLEPPRPGFEERGWLRATTATGAHVANFADDRWSRADGSPPEFPITDAAATAPHWALSGQLALVPQIGQFLAAHPAPRLDEATRVLERVLAGSIRFQQTLGSSSMLAYGEPAPFSRTFLKSAEEQFKAAGNHDVGEISPDLSLCPPLDRAAAWLGYDKVTASLRVKKRDVSGKQTIIEYGDLAFLFRRGDSEASLDRLSFGQRRLFAFLWYVASRLHSGPIVVDELANGLHHEWIRSCVELISETQAFLSTQHPLLIDYMPDDVTFIRCSTTDDGTMVWENFTDAQHARLVDARHNGVLHLSEILQTESLW